MAGTILFSKFFLQFFYLSISLNSEIEPVTIPFDWVVGLFEGLVYFLDVLVVKKRVSASAPIMRA